MLKCRPQAFANPRRNFPIIINIYKFKRCRKHCLCGDKTVKLPKKYNDYRNFLSTGIIYFCNQIANAKDNYLADRIEELVGRGGYSKCPESLHYAIRTKAAAIGVSAERKLASSIDKRSDK